MSECEVIIKMDNHLKLKGGTYVQDLTRCKDCRHCEQRNNEEPDCHQHGMIVTDMYFCADGEKGVWTP